MLRILHVLDHSLPLHSGYTFRTLAILREQRARGWTTVQLTSPKQGVTGATQEVVDGWAFERTPVPAAIARSRGPVALLWQMAATARRLTALIRRDAPHIVHAHSPVLDALPALWAARRARIPVVYEVRALWEDAATDHGTTQEQSLRYRASRGLETAALRRVDHVTTICEGLRNEVTARGVPRDRITVIPNAVDVEAFKIDTAPDPELRRVLRLDGRIVLGFAGSFYRYEGIDLMLEAVAGMPTDAPISVLLLGGGPQETALRERAAALGLADRVIFTGRIAHEQVARYYDLIDVLVYPRRSMRLTELVTPLKPLEGMAQGRIVLASGVGGHRELIRNGETGFLFPPDDAQALRMALGDLLRRREEWPRIREAARRFVERERTWRSSVARYEPVYQRLVDAPAVAAAEA